MEEILSSYNFIIGFSIIIILSFFFSEVARKTNIPSVLMLIALGIGLQFGLEALGLGELDFFPILEVLGIVGLIMIVLEAALELELKREKLLPIAIAFLVALVGLGLSMWVAAIILQEFLGMSTESAWMYATPLSILSSAIIIPSVSGLSEHKKEFHIYESTFSDILGIMVFYFLAGQLEASEHSSGLTGFSLNLLLTLVISVIASYLIILIFQNIRSHTKLFMLIAVLLLLYAIGKKMHLSSLIIILIFGLLIANMNVFFSGRLSKWLHLEKANSIYEGLHVLTMEAAFVVRTFFFVIFGLTIALDSLGSLDVALISLLILASIYLIRYLLLRVFVGKDIVPQLFIAPRGLITILLFYDIPDEATFPGFESGILLFIIMGTSLIMTFGMIYDKRRSGQSIRQAMNTPIGYERWKAPSIEEINKS
ncbi:MAG TPA: cation:proton antiporter [Saprospiraceae bacterium]|nr:cation:proton antiporter [Saprospiraceae bacterium]HMQ85385.1 cation:proton antiporter [Saprospiraceae bacterium]